MRDGSLAPSLVLGNTILDFAILVSELAISHGGFAFFESPVSRAAHSLFAIAGREDHASMWDDHRHWVSISRLAQYKHISFDSCCTRVHPCVQKTTQLSATPSAASRRAASTVRTAQVHLAERAAHSRAWRTYHTAMGSSRARRCRATLSG
eukprot:1310273-Prymnesium_polylepis.1